jgi:hypothetical protein
MSGVAPLFWSTPLKYCSWAARERPAFFWSVVVGAAGPILMPIVPPIRHMLGDIDPAPVPVTYPGTSPTTQSSSRKAMNHLDLEEEQ